MTLNDIYTDIHSKLVLSGVNESKIYFLDIVKSINDSIRETRFEYLKGTRVGDIFSFTETINTFTESSNYPYLNQAALSKTPLKDFPIEKVFIGATSYATENEILDENQTFQKESFATKGDYTYVAIRDITSENTYNLTFSPYEIRTYYKQSDIQFKAGSKIYDYETKKYYVVNQTFIANFDGSLQDNTDVTELAWKRFTTAYKNVAFYCLHRVNELRNFGKIDFASGITVDKSTLLVTKNTKKIVLTYIPEWEDITDPSVELNIPDFFIPTIKYRAMAIIASKIGIQIDLEKPKDE